MDWIEKIATTAIPPWAAAGLMLLAILFTKGVDALLKIKKQRVAAREQDFTHESMLIERLSKRIDALETDIRAERDEHARQLEKEHTAHMECIRKTGILEGRVNQLSLDMSEILKRHSERNIAEIARQKDSILEKVEDKLAQVAKE